MRRVVIASLLVVGLLGMAVPSARADDGDGLYRRFDGDFTLSAGAGGGVVTASRMNARGAVWADFRARYLDTAGLYLAPEWRPDAFGVLGVGVDLRPLFPALFLLDASTGSAWLDLLLGSVGVDLGVALLPLDDDVRAALAVGFGFDVPLLLPEALAHGVYLRLSARHLYSGAGDQGGSAAGLAEWTFGATLSVRFAAWTGLANGPSGER